MPTDAEVKADIEAIYKYSRPALDGPCTARLEDENQPDGMVIVEDRYGAPVAFMSRKVYEAYARLADERKPA